MTTTQVTVARTITNKISSARSDTLFHLRHDDAHDLDHELPQGAAQPRALQRARNHSRDLAAAGVNRWARR